MLPKTHDIVVVGSGPGGYTAAIRAAQVGFNVAVIEKEKNLGGVCLNWGCIPTKALLDASGTFFAAKNEVIPGVKYGDVQFDFSEIIAHSRASSEKLASGVSYLMKKNNITVYNGVAKVHCSGELKVENKKEEIKVCANCIILATGAKLRDLGNIKRDGNRIWNASDALIAKHLPKSICIVGSGAIGIEFACFFSDLGSSVTIIEVQDRILPLEDGDVSTAITKMLKKKGLSIHTSSIVNSCEYIENEKVRVSFSTKTDQVKSDFDILLLAVGVEGNSSGLGLENTDIVVGKGGFVEVNDNFETSEKGIFAIGDLIGAPCLAHKAAHEAIVCIDKMVGICSHNLDKNNIPSCIFLHPYQIASVGLTEKAAKEAGYDIKIGRFNSSANGRSVIMGLCEGFVKVISNAITGELLGIHIVGCNATEMISAFTVGRAAEAVSETLRSVIFPHPTVSEMIHEAVLDLDKTSINS